ncbi:CheR family methyltransferase [Variovorax sp. Root411]|uniref:CheR family methyltransferase n=1 Tax=Variovorax sp. Root411 TaxID=1736530 RepID=UPI0006F8A4B4|nr:CheR family methyltransferase [Variovorax sp. Root411]KQW54339.1 histidine kinase [Variovorax sp. Root411]
MNDLTPDHFEEALGDEIDDAVPSRGYRMLPVVGLGGSAGGMEALAAFFETTPADTGVAFVVVLQMAAANEGALAQVLQRSTRMRVVPVSERERIEADTVYVIAPGKALRTRGAMLEAADIPHDRGRHVAVDYFFRALADTHGPHAVAVVLSGVDGGGAIGVKRIKERGGLTIAQEPQEAQHNGMARSAIATGMIDWVLPVREIGRRIDAYLRIEAQLQLPPEGSPANTVHDGEDADESALREVLSFVRSHTGRDFGDYKRATVLRRIGRRMQVNGVSDLAAYLDCLRTRPGEAGALLQDMLISVTNFFRDTECFRALEDMVHELFRNKTASDTVRVWVVACATGEEAYSLAMLLSEHARTLESPPSIQIFATDLDEDAIRAGRQGLYPMAVEADVSDERLSRFFMREPRGYRVRREVRETVLFAVHDVLKDSPFSRIDLVTCRNLLIYLNRDAQARVFDTLHFALVPGGRLFLGASEAVADDSPLFSDIDKKHRIYAKRSIARAELPMPAGRSSSAAIAMEMKRSPPVISAGAYAQAQRQPVQPLQADGRPMTFAELHLKLLDRLAPPTILLDAEYEMLHISPAATQFLHFSGGEPSRNVLRAILPDLRAELQTALYHVAGKREPVTLAPVPVRLDDAEVEVSLGVQPVQELGGGLLVTLRHEAAPAREQGPAVARVGAEPLSQHLEREVTRLKAQLRETVEQYETSAEELKASNEELHAMNEELHSATEQLETSREELQSLNEELTTVNHQLKSKVEDLGHASSDMMNLMDAMAIATVFLDRGFRVTRFTPSAVSVFKLIASDVGRPLSDLTTPLDYPQLMQDARGVLETLQPTERLVGDANGRWYLARARPYRTIEDRIAGVVLTFVDVTERKEAQESLRQSQERFRLVLENAVDFAIFSVDMERKVKSWNTGAQRLLGYTEAEILGQAADLIFTEEDRAGGAPQEEFRTALSAGRASDDRLHQRKDGSRFWASGALMPMHNGEGEVIGMVKVLRDQSEQRAAQEEVEQSRAELLDALRANESARKALEAADVAKDRFLAVLSHELRNPLASISGAAELLAPDAIAAPDQARASRVIQRQAAAMKVLLGDLLDVSSLRRGRLVLRRERVSAQDIADAAVEATLPLVEHGGHSLELRIAANEIAIDADPIRLAQVVSNLLSNAAKYTPERGAIVLDVRAAGGDAVFEVTDNGIGMEPHMVEAMFEMFAQSAHGRERAAGGLGIGLALVRSIVELHGGTVTGSSEGRGRGSRFTVRIPLAGAQASAQAGKAPVAPQHTGAAPADGAPRVLLADDNADALWGMARMLALSGFTVQTASNGAEALTLAEHFQPDAAVLDIGMPDMDGHEVARRIRAAAWGRGMFLVAATGWGQPEDKRTAMEAGFDEHLVKPVAAADVQRLLRKRGHARNNNRDGQQGRGAE